MLSQCLLLVGVYVSGGLLHLDPTHVMLCSANLIIDICVLYIYICLYICESRPPPRASSVLNNEPAV
jgi:hypothetical protein